MKINISEYLDGAEVNQIAYPQKDQDEKFWKVQNRFVIYS